MATLRSKLFSLLDERKERRHYSKRLVVEYFLDKSNEDTVKVVMMFYEAVHSLILVFNYLVFKILASLWYTWYTR